jgi:hypothetical protein
VTESVGGADGFALCPADEFQIAAARRGSFSAVVIGGCFSMPRCRIAFQADSARLTQAINRRAAVHSRESTDCPDVLRWRSGVLDFRETVFGSTPGFRIGGRMQRHCAGGSSAFGRLWGTLSNRILERRDNRRR